MSTTRSLLGSSDALWKDVKVDGGSKSELTKVVAQIRSQVRDEKKIFSVSTSSLSMKSKSSK
jgi:hypothetical protein